jgi:hypothetical protein
MRELEPLGREPYHPTPSLPFDLGDQWVWLLLVVGIGLTVIVYLPVLDNGFSSDDFAHLAFAAEHGFDFRFLFCPITNHLQPVFRFLLATELSCFGPEPASFHVVSIALHLLNMMLVTALYSRWFKNRLSGVVAGAVFGLTACHWRAVMWIIVQGQQLATMWFLLSAFFFLGYLRTGRWRDYTFCVLSHLLMLFTFSAGLEVPFLFFLVFLLESPQRFPVRKRFISGAWCMIPLCFNIAVLLLARSTVHLLLPKEWEELIINAMGNREGFLSFAPAALVVDVLGLSFGFLRSLTGSYPLESLMGYPFGNYDGATKPLEGNAAFIAVGLSFVFPILFMGFLVWWVRPQGKMSRKERGRALCLIFWALALYYLAVLSRLRMGTFFVITRSRYLYLPCTAIAGLVALLARHLEIHQSGRKRSLTITVLILAFIFTLTSNLVEIRQRENFVDHQTQLFDSFRRTYLKEVDSLLKSPIEPPIQILNRPFSTPDCHYAGWNVKPSDLATLYLPLETRTKLQFLPGTNPSPDTSRPFFTVEQGHLVRQTR